MPQPRQPRLRGRADTLVLAGLAVAIAAAGGITWAATSTRAGTARPITGKPDVEIAGPLGPDRFTTVASYFKRVTFPANELGQAQYIAARLPAGKYLVEIAVSDAPVASGSDCMGVSFPLSQSGSNGSAFRGYVSVAHDGDSATVRCYETATRSDASATYLLNYSPVGSIS